ncbi:MAG TPA: A/G-specific adenine glycosylase [Bacteroidia bacterium]|nr:A/G-specific adenine glycosylase [Bacteroidia bacterium]
MNISNKLILWYERNKRELPFRSTKDAYRIWLSEVILQQTRVEQGLPYYYRFLESFPTVKHLAKASETEVLKLWQGLGYYSRGRNLLATAQHISKILHNKFPSNYLELKKLKGVGDYTAAAIASMAFNEPVFTVDGNVARVLSRLFAEKTTPNSSVGKKVFQQLADNIGNKKFPGLHNQAMMELGALVCTPRNPKCEICPLQSHCLAYQQKQQLNFPVKSKKIKIKERHFCFIILLYRNKFYIRQRNGNDIWKNLYEFPLLETQTKISSASISKFAKNYGVTKYESGRTHIHKLTHQHIHASYIVAHLSKPISPKKFPELKAVDAEDFKNNFPHPRLIEKILSENNYFDLL